MAKNWISFPRVEGTASRQAHVDLPEGTYEREMSKEGFFGPSAQLHHKHPPTGWSDWEGPLKPRAFDLTKLNAAVNSPWDAVEVLHNAHCRIGLYCDFGHLAFGEGDYVMLPRGTQWRITTTQPVTALLVEATNDSYRLPEKGLVGHHAIFDPAMLDTPHLDDAFKAQQVGAEGARPWKVQIKRRGAISTVTYPYNPLDVVGWHGDLMPVKINWRDFRPIMSHRFHMPPSVHTTFAAGRFVVCTFVPRPIETDPGALKVPFFHNNDDYDEVIFYHRGNFFSRDNIHPGMVTLHPCGFPHGPHPKAFAAGAKAARKETDEVAVMIDARNASPCRAWRRRCSRCSTTGATWSASCARSTVS